MKKRNNYLQDIYRTPKARAKDPDHVVKMPPEMERQIRRHQIQSALLGLLSIALVASLALLLVHETRVGPAPLLITMSEENRYVPHYTLPLDDLWVMSYQHAERSLASEIKQGTHPVSTKWIKNVAYHSILGQQALAVKEYAKAVIHLENVLTIFPEIQGVNGALGTAYLRQKNFEAAIAPLQAALEEEECFSILSNLGIAFLATEQLEQAENYLLRAMALQPGHPSCQKNLALLYQKMERPKQATLHFENYLALYPDDFKTTENYSEYLLLLGKREQASAFLRKACLQETEAALPLYLLLARIEAGATNEVKAVEALKNITRYISPNLALIKFNMEDFDPIRETEAFQKLLHQVEIAEVTLENQGD